VLYVPVLFYPEPWNGIMEHLQVLLARLDRNEFEPLLGTRPDDGTQTASLAERAQVPVVDLGSSRSVGALLRVFRDVRPDIVHVHTPSTSGLAKLALAARLARVPRLVLTMHQVAPDPQSWRTRAVNRAGHHLIHATIAVSAGAADTQARHAGLARRRMEIIHNGVEDVAAEVTHDNPLAGRNGEVWAGYFGRLAAEKGVDTLVEAVGAVRASGVDVRLLVAGEGYERAALEARAHELGCESAVRFAGYRTDARALMKAVDIVVHPPRFEGFGLVVVEAMQAGRPVIATDVAGGIPELVRDGETGVLVPADDVPALASALGRLACDPGLRAALGAAGRSRYESEFAADRMFARTIRRYSA
jgi:glycosyltransferase involved in cell wall biosynthesis